MTLHIRIWDLPTRVFHWSLALSVAAALATGWVGGNWMVWHGRLGLLIAGPGQMPAMPQPMPKIRLPITSWRSGSRLLGNCIGQPVSDCWRRRARVKGISAAAMPPPMTKASDGSQLPARSRKASTLAGLAMPASSRPRPNSRPARKAVRRFMLRLRSGGGRRRRWRSRCP